MLGNGGRAPGRELSIGGGIMSFRVAAGTCQAFILDIPRDTVVVIDATARSASATGASRLVARMALFAADGTRLQDSHSEGAGIHAPRLRGYIERGRYWLVAWAEDPPASGAIITLGRRYIEPDAIADGDWVAGEFEEGDPSPYHEYRFLASAGDTVRFRRHPMGGAPETEVELGHLHPDGSFHSFGAFRSPRLVVEEHAAGEVIARIRIVGPRLDGSYLYRLHSKTSAYPSGPAPTASRTGVSNATISNMADDLKKAANRPD